MERRFDHQLDELKQDLLQMSGAVEESIEQAVRALVDRNGELVNLVIEGGKKIDSWEIRIEEQCLNLLATHGPVASDLRLLACMMKINDDLERINDEAVNIAQQAAVLNELPLLKPLIDIPRMSVLAQGMVKDALDSFVHLDVDLARAVGKRDEELDLFRDQIFRELLTYMNSSLAVRDTIDRGIYLILVSRHLERVGDHASNIAENVAYLTEGQIVRHQKEEWWEGGSDKGEELGDESAGDG